MVKIEHVCKKYGKRSILEDITFSAQSGERIAIIGRNGCGKSTLMQILAGITKADGGSISYFGRNPWREKKLFRTLCGYVPQENPLMEELSVRDNLRLYGATDNNCQHDLMSFFELDDMMRTPVSKLSGGMKRRVSIACAVFYQPAILFMDEPTTALDLYYKATIHEWMDLYKEKNGILIMTTHDEQEIAMCDRCFFMEQGRVRELSGKEKEAERIRDLIMQV